MRTKKHKIPIVRRKRQAVGWMILAILLFVSVFILALCKVSGESSEASYEYRNDSEETTIHPQEVVVTSEQAYNDVVMLAKIMQAESGVNWPDWAVLCIGEVVLNRVENEAFPDTIYEVLHQDNPIQYAPVWVEGWNEMEPGAEYIDLARRLLDGERVMKNPGVIWQALFPQGERVVITYYDKALDTTTYFCE